MSLLSGETLRRQFAPADQRRFNIVQYGATGDGIADDTGPIHAAWSALVSAGGGELFFPGGKYRTTGLVFQGGSHFTIRADGDAHIRTSRATAGAPNQATHNVVTVADCTDFSVTGLVIDGCRDEIAGDQWLTANAVAGQNTVTVQDGTKYAVGEMVQVFGGLTASGGAEKDFQEAFRRITAIGGNVLTLDANHAHSYTATSASGGPYVTRYQTGWADAYVVAGRNLGNEDAQNALHLLTCERFVIRGNICRNVWESPIKLGTGFAPTNITDGCRDGIITGNQCHHGYDQGVSVWVSERITVVGNVCRDAGWGGIVFTCSDDCVATGNVCTGNIYRVPLDTLSGSGIAIEGCERVVVSSNICDDNYSNGIRFNRSPVFTGFTTINGALAPGATTLVLNSVPGIIRAGTRHAVSDPVDPTKTENVRVTAFAGNTVTFTPPLRNAYAAGAAWSPRYNSAITILGNSASRNTVSAGISVMEGHGIRIIGNSCFENGVGVDTVNTYGIVVTEKAHGAEVIDNTVARNSQDGIMVENLDGVKVRGNRVYRNGLHNTNKHGIKLFGIIGGEVAHNTVEHHGDCGIFFQNSGGRNITRVRVEGNHARRNGGRGLYHDYGPGQSLVIVNNEFTHNGESGIDLRGVKNSLVQGNTCANNGQVGIRIADAGADLSLYNVIDNNLLYDDQTGPTQAWGIQEVGSSGTSRVTSNRAYGHVNAGQLSLAASSSAANNGLGATPTWV